MESEPCLRRHIEDSSKAFAASVLEIVGGQHHVLDGLPPPSEGPDTRCTRVGGPRGRSGQAREISPTPGFDAVCSEDYTDLVIPPFATF